MTGRGLLQLSGAVIDLVYRVERPPRSGEEALVRGTPVIAPGGGFNAMIAALRSGMKVAYGGPLGSGAFADILLRALKAEGIPALQEPLEDVDQGSCVVMVEDSGERTFLSQAGAEGVMTARRLAALDAADFDWLLLSGYSLSYPGARGALADWLADSPDGAFLVFDPGPAADRIEPRLLAAACARSHWISANASEAAILTGESGADKAAEILASGVRSGGGGAVVRCGADGCWIASAKRSVERIPGFAVEAIDANGAGDAHVGSFIAALARGEDPMRAARLANASAALSTTGPGPATAPGLAEAKALIARAQAA